MSDLYRTVSVLNRKTLAVQVTHFFTNRRHGAVFSLEAEVSLDFNQNAVLPPTFVML
jgi:hypothetical protein